MQANVLKLREIEFRDGLPRITDQVPVVALHRYRIRELPRDVCGSFRVKLADARKANRIRSVYKTR